MSDDTVSVAVLHKHAFYSQFCKIPTPVFALHGVVCLSPLGSLDEGRGGAADQMGQTRPLGSQKKGLPRVPTYCPSTSLWLQRRPILAILSLARDSRAQGPDPGELGWIQAPSPVARANGWRKTPSVLHMGFLWAKVTHHLPTRLHFRNTHGEGLASLVVGAVMLGPCEAQWPCGMKQRVSKYTRHTPRFLGSEWAIHFERELRCSSLADKLQVSLSKPRKIESQNWKDGAVERAPALHRFDPGFWYPI